MAQFHSQSKESMQHLRGLREQFETVIAMMHEFLETGLQTVDISDSTVRMDRSRGNAAGVKVS